MAEIGQDIGKAAYLLKKGNVVAIPTETVYGLAANALDNLAVEKIFKAKRRPTYNPLIVHIKDIDSIRQYITSLPRAAKLLAEKFWPGPLTLILPKSNIIPQEVTSGLPNVAIRIPGHPMTLALLQSLPFPLAAPSANPFGYISPTTALHVEQQLGDRIPYILDGGPCGHGLESTIIYFREEKPILYRYGAISREEIEDLLQTPLETFTKTSLRPQGPGMLPYHYSPHTKIRLVKDPGNQLTNFNLERTGVISFTRPVPGISQVQQIVLSEKGNLFEAGKNLYKALRQLDQLDLEVILIERMPEEGLGHTINDRLERAAAR